MTGHVPTCEVLVRNGPCTCPPEDALDLDAVLHEHESHRDWPASYRAERGLPAQCFRPEHSITSQTTRCLTYRLARELADLRATLKGTE